MSVASLLSHRRRAIDPRLEPADVVSVIATLVAGLSLVWRRTRPVASFCVFVAGCLVVTPDRPLHRAALGAPAVQPLLPGRTRARRRHGRRSAWSRASSCSSASPCSTSPTWARPTCCRRARSSWRRGRSATRSARAAPSRPSGSGWPSRRRLPRASRPPAPSSRSGCGSPASCTTSSRTACRLIAVQAGVGGHVIRTDVAAAEHAPRGHRRDQPQGADPDPLDARPAPRRGRRARRPARSSRSTTSTPWSRTCSEAGVDVSLTIEGTPRPLDAERRADRLPDRAGVPDQRAQALRRHACSRRRWPTSRTVSTSRSATRTGPERARVGGSRRSGGHGLLGLRERARLLGGDLEYGAVSATASGCAPTSPTTPVAAP